MTSKYYKHDHVKEMLFEGNALSGFRPKDGFRLVSINLITINYTVHLRTTITSIEAFESFLCECAFGIKLIKS